MSRIPGTPLLGFAQLFDDVNGRGDTPRPYPYVVPSAVGPALLPFACPHCGADCGELVHPERRMHYYDAERKFCWCPKCRGRFFVDRVGEPLREALPAGQTVAPSRVVKRELVGLPPETVAQMQERSGNPEAARWTRTEALGGRTVRRVPSAAEIGATLRAVEAAPAVPAARRAEIGALHMLGAVFVRAPSAR